MSKTVKTKKTGRKVVVKKPPKQIRKSNFNGDASLSDGGFSDQFGKHNAPVLFNNMDTVGIQLSATGDSAPLLQDFPDPTDPMLPKPFTVISDFTNNPVVPDPGGNGGAGQVTVDHAAPLGGGLNPDPGPASGANAAIAKVPVWAWLLVIAVVIGAVVYISKKK